MYCYDVSVLSTVLPSGVVNSVRPSQVDNIHCTWVRRILSYYYCCYFWWNIGRQRVTYHHHWQIKLYFALLFCSVFIMQAMSMLNHVVVSGLYLRRQYSLLVRQYSELHWAIQWSSASGYLVWTARKSSTYLRRIWYFNLNWEFFCLRHLLEMSRHVTKHSWRSSVTVAAAPAWNALQNIFDVEHFDTSWKHGVISRWIDRTWSWNVNTS